MFLSARTLILTGLNNKLFKGENQVKWKISLHIKRQSDTQNSEKGKQQDHLTKGSKIQILDTNVHLVSFVAMAGNLNLSELLIMKS